MDHSAALKVGAAQKGMAAKTGIPSEAPAFGPWDKEQALSPGVIGHIEPVLAALGLKRRALQQSFAVPKKPLSATGRNGMVRGNNDPAGTERERKKRTRPGDQGAQR